MNAKIFITMRKQKLLYYYSLVCHKVIYVNIIKEKKTIYENNRGKCGIYKWTNKVNGKSYIGSSTNLTKRMYSYYCKKFLYKKLTCYNSKIYKALLEYNYNFTLGILEYLY